MSRLLSAAGRMAVTASLLLSALVSVAAPSQLPVDGLIVKLKGADTHERMKALGAKAEATETARTLRVMQMARVTEARTRPSGVAAQHLSFGRMMKLAEAEAMAARLRQQPEVEWVELNTRERLLQAAPVVPNDEFYAYFSPTDLGQWWLRPPGETAGAQTPSYGAPDVQSAWALQRGLPSAVVAVLDTGRTLHPDLNDRYLPGYDFVSDVAYANDGNGRDTDPSDPGDWVTSAEAGVAGGPFEGCDVQDSSWHGTVISGIVAAKTNNTIGVAGINRDGRILPVRVATKCGATVEDITDGMRWAAGLAVTGAPVNQNPARIINVSFGGSAPCGPLYQQTINELTNRGVVVIAAAGNESGAVTRPASCTGVVGVAALARDGLKAYYSNFGPQIVVSTVGGDDSVDDGILTTVNTGTTSPDRAAYNNVLGTSFSTPIVAGTVSLMLSANPNLTVPQIIGLLQATARPHVGSTQYAACSSTVTDTCVCTTSTCGAGILDAPQAVRAAGGAPPAPAPGGDGGGGGALGWMWLTGLGLAVVVLARSRSARGRAGSERLAE